MRKIFTTLAIVMMMCSCTDRNPFLSEWDTPYGIPDYSIIKESDYIPAIKAGIRQQSSEIDAIIAVGDAPTFDNTIVPFERSGAILDRVIGVLFNLSESDATESLQEIVEKVTPMISEHSDDIFMNPYLFEKVEDLFKQRESLDLTREQQMVLKDIYESFVRNGISLDAEGQKRMREINSSLASLELQFGNNILAESNAFKAEFGISVSEYPVEMSKCEDRALREKMFKAYSSRGNNGNKNDNKENVLKIMRLRIEKAALLGYDCPANFILESKMAHDAPTVDKFLDGIMPAAVAKAKEELAELQAMMDEDVAAGILPADSTSTIQPWDWFYYSERVRKAKYDLNDSLIKPYFQMENVREGVFATASKLYGLNFKKLEDVPLYNPDVEVFEVSDSDGSLIGILMTDYFPRSTKRGGAWMNNVRNQEIDADGNDIRPIIVNVGNFSKPTEDAPSLLTLDEVETMFHEFGHALHGLLSKCSYKDVSGTSVARDFVELPSQINENWAFQREVLSGYARHYQTGEVIPQDLVEKILAADNFAQGFMTTELAAASILDMKWHELGSVEGVDVEAFEKLCCEQMGLIDEIIPRYRTTYFNHVFSGGYSAGYYSYLWAEVLDKDAFELFKQKGIFDKATSMSFRHNILEKGGSEEPMVLYKRFRGAEPDPTALLRARGLM